MSREVMEKALEALELWENSLPNWWVCSVDNKSHEAIAALRAALAADELTKESERLGLYSEPVAWEFTLDGCRQVMLDEDADEAIRHHGIPLYRHPPAAKLTDEEILAANMTQNGWPYVAANRQQVLAFARAIEARVRGVK